MLVKIGVVLVFLLMIVSFLYACYCFLYLLGSHRQETRENKGKRLLVNLVPLLLFWPGTHTTTSRQYISRFFVALAVFAGGFLVLNYLGLVQHPESVSVTQQ